MSSSTFRPKIQTPHWNAELYKKHSILLQQSSALELLKTFPFTNPQARVLDIGCGDGKITRVIAEDLPNGFVEGVDLSEDMIELAKKDYASINNMRFSVMDAEKISFPEKSFDYIVSFFCLQWVGNKELAFKNIAKLLSPEGKAALIMTDRNPHLLKVRGELFKTEQWSTYFNSYQDVTRVIDNDQYEKYAQEAGLKDIEFTQKSKTITFDSRDELRAFVKMVTPALKQLPTDDLKEKFVDELLDGYLKEIGLQNYSITYQIKTLRASSVELKLENRMEFKR